MREFYKGFYQWIYKLALKSPEKKLITVDNCSLTWREVIASSQEIKNGLREAGFSRGDRAVIVLPNSIDWYCAYWGILLAGGIPVPLSPQIGKWELMQIFKNINIKSAFITPRFRSINHLEIFSRLVSENEGLVKIFVCAEKEIFEDEKFTLMKTEPTSIALPDLPEPQDSLMLACTSGSTGNPKIITVAQKGFFQAEWDMAEYLEFSSEDVMLLGMPLYHLGGFGMGLQMVIKGGEVIYQGRFAAALFLKKIQERGVTILQLTSTLAKILISDPDFDKYDISSVRLCYFAGEVLPNELAARFYDTLGIRVVNIIGSTETTTMLVWDSDTDREYDCNTYVPLPFTRVKLIADDTVGEDDIGIIHIATDGILKEYYGNPKETAEKIYERDGIRWFITGDLGKRLPNGRIQFIGRKKRIIKRGANLVFPEEIEAFLLTHKDIEAVAVTMEPQELLGEMIIAYIQAKAEKKLTGGKLIEYCKGNLSSYKIPDKLIIVKELPKDIGKIQYKKLRK